MVVAYCRFPFTSSPARFVAAILVILLLATGCASNDETPRSPTAGTDTAEASDPGVAADTSAPTTESAEQTAQTAPPTDSTSTTDGGAADSSMRVYFSVGDGSDCAEVAPFPRPRPAAGDPIQVAFDELVSGPDAGEIVGGASPMFSSDTSGSVVSASLTDGLLVVDFTDLAALLPNAATSCGSQALMAQLNETAFQFTEVDRVRYRINGSCDDFANWLQRDCFDLARDGNTLPVSIIERATHAGCTPPAGDALPDGRWFGLISSDGITRDRLPFDLACWFTGTAAIEASAADNEESPPPNDYYVRNNNDTIRVLPIKPSSTVAWLPDPGNPLAAETMDYASWLDQLPTPGLRSGVWIVINEGIVVSVEEQFVP